MTDANVTVLCVAAGTLINSVALVVKALATRLDRQNDDEKIRQLQAIALANHSRIDNLEIGNLADAAARGLVEKDKANGDTGRGPNSAGGC